MLAAAAVVLMCIGTILPIATYAAPALCILVCRVVLTICGNRIAWAWYGAVAILSLLLAPDKEAAAVFLCLGYYPIVKPRLDRKKLSWLWKALLFNCSILTMYWILLKVIGVARLVSEFSEMSLAVTAVLLLLGNVTFFVLDMRLSRGFRKRKRGRA